MDKIIDSVIDRTLLCAFALYVWAAVLTTTAINIAYLFDYAPITTVVNQHHTLYNYFNIQTAWCFLVAALLLPLVMFATPRENRGALSEMVITLFVIVLRGIVLPVAMAVFLVVVLLPFIIAIEVAVNGTPPVGAALGGLFIAFTYYFLFTPFIHKSMRMILNVLFVSGPTALVRTQPAISRAKQHIDYRKPVDGLRDYLLSELRG